MTDYAIAYFKELKKNCDTLINDSYRVYLEEDDTDDKDVSNCIFDSITDELEEDKI